LLSVDAKIELNAGFKGRLDLLRSSGRLGWQNRNKIERYPCQLLEHLKCIRAIASSSP
jgi:hypothetical protein